MTTQNQPSTHQFQALSVDEKIQQNEEKEAQLLKNYGTMIPIMVNANTGQPKYILGPHFYIFIPTWLISVGLIIYILKSLYWIANLGLWIASAFFCFIFLYIYAKIGFSLPGIASGTMQPDMLTRSQERYCIPCKIIRPKGTRHCYYCDVCIYQLDHHCPWVGKCIGRDNLILFYIFLVSIGFMMGSLLVTALTATTTT